MNQPHVNQQIERELRALRLKVEQLDAAVKQRDRVIGATAQIVGARGESLTAQEIVARVGSLRIACTEAMGKLGAIEKQLAVAGGCEVDAVGVCHAHGRVLGCPIAGMRALFVRADDAGDETDLRPQ